MVKIAITGLGLVSPLGRGPKAHFAALAAQKSCLLPSGLSPPYPALLGRVDQAGLEPHLDRSTALALMATRDALADCGLPHKELCNKTAITVSNSKGAQQTIFRALSDYYASHTAPNKNFIEQMQSAALGTHIAKLLGDTSSVPQISYAAACATGPVSILAGADMIATGRAPYALCGATESSLTPLILAGFQKMGVLYTGSNPKGFAPFDKQRMGFVPGEGAAVLFLEDYQAAMARKARIYAVIVSGHLGNDCSSPVEMNPDGSSIAPVIAQAIKSGGLSPQEIGYINAHGTATIRNDQVELAAIGRIWPQQAPFISGTKPLHGHLLGATGALEVGLCALMLHHNRIFPTLHTTELASRKFASSCLFAPQAAPDFCLTTSMGFGGHIAALVLAKAQARCK